MAPLSEMFWFLIGPFVFMSQSLSYLPGTVLRLLRDRQYSVLLSPSRLQSAWFAAFWAAVGPGARDMGQVRVIPLLEGRVSGGKISDETAGRGVGGTVLEVGPGAGDWVGLFSAAKLSPGLEITHIYGVEPNPEVHAALRQNIAAAGLQDTYEIVPTGIEDLASSGRVAKESVDCIVSVFCLCSIPDPQRNVEELYGYLKPGGRWFVYEHVRCDSEGLRECGLGMRVYQSFINLLWPHMIGGCQLCRNTGKTLREAGPWTKIDLVQPDGEPWYHPLPHILGTLVK